jgi:hypothetical protein
MDWASRGLRLAERPASKRLRYPKSSKSERKAPKRSSPIFDRTRREEIMAVANVTAVSPNDEIKFNAERRVRPDFIFFRISDI